MANRKNEPISTFNVKCAECNKIIDMTDKWDEILSKYFCNVACREDYKKRHNL